MELINNGRLLVVTHYQNYLVWAQNSTTYLLTAKIFAQIRKGDTSNTKHHQSLEIRELQFVKKKSSRKCSLIGKVCARFEERLLWATQKHTNKLFVQRI
jgi:hypothetical protein